MKQIFIVELNRILIKERILATLIIFILFGTVFQCVTMKVPNQQIYEQHEDYLDTYKFLEGPLTIEKDDFITKKDLEIKSNEINNQNAIKDYKEDKISLEKFKSTLKSKADIENQVELFNNVKKQYEYVKKIGNVEFIDVNGLTVLVTGQFDFVLYLFMIILVITIYLRDIESGMDVVISTTKSGNRNIWLVRFIIAVLLATLAFIGVETFRYIYILLIYGISNLSTNISTSSIIGNTKWNLSFLQLYIVVIVLKIIWIFLTTHFLVHLCRYIKNSLYNFVFNFILIILPYMIFSSRILSFNPLIGLNEPINYFKGTILSDNNVIFKAFNNKEYLYIICTFFLFVFINIFLETRRRKSNLKVNKILIICICFSIFISVCTHKELLKDVRYNSLPFSHFEKGDNYIFDIENEKFINTKNNEEFLIERDPFVNGTIVNGNYYKNSYYYLSLSNNSYEIRKLNLDTFESVELFKVNAVNIDNIFRDIMRYTTSLEDIKIEIPDSIFCDGNTILLFYKNKIEFIDLQTNKKQILIKNSIIPTVYSIQYDNIYYLDSYYQLHKYHLSSKKDEILFDELVTSFCIDNGKVYYRELKSGYVYEYNKKNHKKIIDVNILYFYVNNEQCYYVEESSLLPYCYDIVNNNKVELVNYKVYSFIVEQNNFYYSYYEEKDHSIRIDYKKNILDVNKK